LLVIALVLLAGCTTSSEKGKVTRHYVFGFGVVTVDRAAAQAEVRSVRAFGVYGSAQQFAAGYVDTLSTLVPDGTTNLLIEVRK